MASTPTSVELTPAPTLAAETPNDEKQTAGTESLASLGRWLKYLLLAFFCLGQFLDTLNNSAVLPALPAITHNVNLTESDAVWLLAAYQATFASFLLISGRVSDIYSPKPVFVVGTIFFGVISLGGGFVKDRIVLIVLRALQGIGASLTIPSALNLLVQMFPEPTEQARAIGMFAAAAAFGNVLGTIIGAILVQYASWRWIFWVIAIIAVPIALASVFLIPTTPRRNDAKISQLDFVGVSTLTAAIILFVYALTTGSISPWASAGVLVPFFISIALVVAFFVWETRVDEKNAALLPLGIAGGIITINGEHISRLGRPKILIIAGLSLSLAGTLLLPFSDRLHDKYWPLVFPALIVGTPGTATIFVLTNISFFRNTPPEYAGTVGAVFNAALQLGVAIGTSATTSIQAAVDERTHSGPGFTGRSAALWFLIAYVALEIVGVAAFYRDERSPNDLEAKTIEAEQADMKEPGVLVA
ncbi:hypothetical protein FRC10_005970 [Ceratobasidium sp. 414]|nr:hypothetical protein FRC10_005970 [Ceratobasidium sp. 414]